VGRGFRAAALIVQGNAAEDPSREIVVAENDRRAFVLDLFEQQGVRTIPRAVSRGNDDAADLLLSQVL
jgi:hypothetical protein